MGGRLSSNSQGCRFPWEATQLGRVVVTDGEELEVRWYDKDDAPRFFPALCRYVSRNDRDGAHATNLNGWWCLFLTGGNQSCTAQCGQDTARTDHPKRWPSSNAIITPESVPISCC